MFVMGMRYCSYITHLNLWFIQALDFDPGDWSSCPVGNQKLTLTFFNLRPSA